MKTSLSIRNVYFDGYQDCLDCIDKGMVQGLTMAAAVDCARQALLKTRSEYHETNSLD